MKLDSLHELYVDKLKRLYKAEHQSLRALPKMAGNPGSSDEEFEAGKMVDYDRGLVYQRRSKVRQVANSIREEDKCVIIRLWPCLIGWHERGRN